MHLRTKLLILSGSIAAALVVPGVAIAGQSHDNDPSIGTVVPGSLCSAAQSHANDGRGAKGLKGDEVYRCRKDGNCFRWKWVYHSDAPKSGRTAWPKPPCNCTPSYSPKPSASPSSSPTTSATPTPSPTGSASAAASPTTTAAGTAVSTSPTGGLAVTPGPSRHTLALLLWAAAISVAVGGALILATRRRRTS